MNACPLPRLLVATVPLALLAALAKPTTAFAASERPPLEAPAPGAMPSVAAQPDSAAPPAAEPGAPGSAPAAQGAADEAAATPAPADAATAQPTARSPAGGTSRVQVAAPEPAGPVATDPAPYDGPPLLFTLHKKPKLGGYGALGVAYTRMLHRDGVVTDLEAGMLIEHRLSLGVAGYLFSRTPRGPAAPDGTPRDFGSGYAGFVARYALYTTFPVYVSFGVLVGGGVVVLGERLDDRHGDSGYRSRDGYDPANDEHAGYAVVQPDLSLHVNVTRWLRFSATGGYRAATEVRRFGYESRAMSGAVAGASVAMGWF